jgi:sulfur carrier protein
MTVRKASSGVTGSGTAGEDQPSIDGSVWLTVNGRGRAAVAGTTVAGVVNELAGGLVRGVAVAVNGEVVPRASWPATVLHDGDTVEVLTAVQGG